MSNALSKITAAILAVILVYLYPAVQSAHRQEDYRALAAYNTLVRFTDAVRNKGYVTQEMYNDFVYELAESGSEYRIDLEHRHKKFHPEYGDAADSSTFLDRFSIHYEAHYSQEILSQLFPEPAVLPVGKRELESGAGPVYLMEVSDYFTVTITALSRTPYTIFNELLYGPASGSGPDAFTYGGMVLNEDY